MDFIDILSVRVLACHSDRRLVVVCACVCFMSFGPNFAWLLIMIFYSAYEIFGLPLTNASLYLRRRKRLKWPVLTGHWLEWFIETNSLDCIISVQRPTRTLNFFYGYYLFFLFIYWISCRTMALFVMLTNMLTVSQANHSPRCCSNGVQMAREWASYLLFPIWWRQEKGCSGMSSYSL